MIFLSVAFSFYEQPLQSCDFASLDLKRSLVLYGLFLGLDWLSALIAFALEPTKEQWRLLLWLPFQRLAYRQVMYVIALRALAAAIVGRRVHWGHNRRHATLVGLLEPLGTEAMNP